MFDHRKELFEDDFDEHDKFSLCRRASKISDLEIIASAVVSDSAGIDNEN